MSTITYNKSQSNNEQNVVGRRMTIWRLAGGILILLTIALYVQYLTQTLAFRQQPFPGFFTTYTMTVNAGVPTGTSVWTGLEDGLQANDHIIGIDGEILGEGREDYENARQDFKAIISTKAVGDDITILFERRERDGIDVDYCGEAINGIAQCEITTTLGAFSGQDFLAYFVLSYVTGIFIIAIGSAAWQLRGETMIGFIITTITMMSAVYAGGIFDVGSTWSTLPIWVVGSLLLSGALVSLGISFPTPITLVRQNQRIALIPMFLGGLAGIGLVVIYNQGPINPWDNQIPQYVTFITIISLIVLFSITLLYQRRFAVTSQLRDQTNTLIIGLSLMLFPGILWFINRFLLTVAQLNLGITFESLVPLYLFPNAAIVYAFLQYRRFDTDRVITHSITYSIMVFALIVSNFLLVLGINFVIQDLVDANHPLLNATLLFGMVALFIPVRNRLQQRIDEIYFRTRRNYQSEQEEFASQLTTFTRYADVVEKFRNILIATLNMSSVFIYLSPNDESDYEIYQVQGDSTDIRFSPSSVTVGVLRESDEAILMPRNKAWDERLLPDRHRLILLKAMVIAPMQGTARLNGFVVMGAPKSGKQTYDYEEMRFINNMVGQLSLATERSQVIDSLERRVRELNVLSQVGQAVNFTIEFDDLLELIYAQTSKLIDATTFYIVLYEESIAQLFFAFFLEGDDRFDEHENIRWALGDDIYSEIIKTSKALKLNDYTREVAIRGDIPNIDTKDVQAWMGVPLTAGRSTVGVIAVGKSGSGDIYSEEQFKIFNDIGALAATSIEKARLFSETRVRERQLTVLNDISRQLVATESDVEKLLQIIMESAVEILNTEAGSLLLNTEDNSGDLEFRVVIGGAGDDLVGQRWEAGKGIVGQVVQTGEPRIVNDAKRDPQHIQDTQDKSAIESFSTDSLLAVPLIAKDNIIGVLEVLNKTDGTPFVEADVNLLTTFAGQAAVAIENARLFRMTDLQLSKRVQELETLENFDNKLNRTLNLSEVASITVNTAIKTLNATAGVLAVYHEEDSLLEVVAIEGYEEEDYPADADNLWWRADSGIVARVIRNRQPDIVTDVSIDPNYTPALRGSLSQLTFPMMSGTDVNAVLILEKAEEPRFSLTDWSFGQRLAEHASIAVANAQLYQELMTANKSKSEFMGFAAHELKNPLSSVKGYSDLMLKGMLGDINDQQRNFINVIYSNANRMETIINDLRDSAKMDANEFAVEVSPIHIHHAVVETLRPFTQVLEEKKQTLINNVRDDLPLVMGDQTRLIQVLTNLVSNAHKYSPEETAITLDAEVRDNFVSPQGTRRGKMLVLSVKDEGLGMSKEDQERLFKERYFRSTNPDALDQPGTGLGMMLTHGIVAKHQGDIWVESDLGEGSTFFIALPLVAEKAPEATPEAGSD